MSPVGPGHGALGSGVRASPGQLGSPPAAVGVAMVTEQASPAPTPPPPPRGTPHPPTRPFKGLRLLGVMETVSRRRSGLPHWLAGPGPRRSFPGSRPGASFVQAPKHVQLGVRCGTLTFNAF